MAVSVGNWTSIIQDFVKGKETADYSVGQNSPNPVQDCLKEFTASYRCGNSTKTKNITIPGEANGKTAKFDCSGESKMCKGIRLTLGDDGNLILTDTDNKQIWTSNTKTIGLVVDKFNAKNGKYGRNYLLAGETLNIGEFIGSPSGNCYLIMNKTSEGNGLELKYSVLNCTTDQFGEDESTIGLFSLARTAYNELMGTTNKVKPAMNKLDKTLDKLVQEEDAINTHTDINQHKMKDITRDYVRVGNAKPVITNHIKQLEAMGEDTSLYLTRYKYRRILWFILAILIILGGIKFTRSS